MSLSQSLDKDNGQPGMYCFGGLGVGNLNFVALVASQGRVSRFRPSRNMSIVSIAFSVAVAAGADDACDVGIYDANFNRIVSSGATTGRLNSVGVKTIPIAVTLLAGVTYYGAFSVGTFGSTAASLMMTQTGASLAGFLFGTTPPLLESTFMNGAHPLPALFTYGGPTGGVPLLAVREF